MPGIVIKEIDKTSAENLSGYDYKVLIPGKTSEYGTEEYNNQEYNVNDGAVFEFKSAAALKQIIGHGEDLDDTYVSYHMAKRLLNLGMKVVYAVTDTLTPELESGAEGFFDQFKDRGEYDLRFITSGGDFEDEIDKTLADQIIACAARRGDATALINVPSEGDESGSYKTADEILEWLDSLDNKPFDVGDIQETPLKYGAAFAGHFTIDNERIKRAGAESGAYEYKKAIYPVYFAYLACFAYYIRSYADWYAMAGSIRGKLPFGSITLGDDARFTDAQIAELQPREAMNPDEPEKGGHTSCNVLANIRPYGNIVWGNRTIHPITYNEEKGTIGLVASNFLNIRQLTSSIKKKVYEACRKFTFEPNTDTLWVRFCNEITPLLEKMKADQGIKGYRLLQENARRAEVKAIIRIIPIEAVEDFDITVELTDSIEIGE